VTSWNILLIDDDPDDYVITKALLTEARGDGFRLTWVQTYEQALEVISRNEVDAVLMDYDLGGRNGVDLIRDALMQGCQAPFILLTGRGSYQVDLEAMQAGAMDYLTKGDVTARMLERAIRYAMERKATERALAAARDELERRVQERTRELQQANEQLAAANARLEEANAVLTAQIEERRRAEAARQESEDLLRYVIQNAPLVLWAFDSQGTVTFYDGRGLETIGARPGELVGQNVLEYTASRPRNQELIRRALQGERLVDYTYSANGIPFETHFSPIFDADGRVEGVIAISIDVAGRMRDQERIAYQARLLDNVNDAIIATDEHFRLTAWNRAAEAIYGWKAEEVLGRSEQEVLRTEVEGGPDAFLECLREAGSLSVELVHHHRDGSPIRIETRAISLLDDTGRITGYAYVNRDITERKQSEERLRQYALRSAALAEVAQLLAEAGTDIERVLGIITRRVAEILGDACVLSLVSDDRQTINTVSIHHTDPEGAEFLRSHLVARSRPADQGLRAQVIQSGEPLLAAGLDQGPFRAVLPEQLWPALERFGIGHLLVVPLRVQGQAIGTLGISRAQSGRPYDPEDQTFLQNLADRAAQAIANARLFEALKTELAERVRAEDLLKSSNQALRESREQLRTVIEGAPVILWAVDRAGTYTLYEGKVLARAGLKPGQMVGQNVFQYLEGNEAGLELMRRALAGESFSAFIEMPEGLIFENHYSPNLLENGEVSGVIGVSIDVTERKKAQEYIAYQARLLENVNDAIIATDEHFRLTAWNRAAEHIYGWKAAEVLGQDVFEVTRTELPGRQRAGLVRLLRKKGAYSGEVVQHHRDGRLVEIETKLIALTDEEGRCTGFVSVNRDITARKRAERKIHQHAQRSEALAELSRLLAEPGMSSPQVLDLIVSQVSELVGGFSLVMLLTPDEQYLAPAAAHHTRPEALEALQELNTEARYRLADHGLSARAIFSEQPILVAEMSDEGRRSSLYPVFHEHLEGYEIYSALIVPLRAGGRVIGVLSMARDEPGKSFTTDDQAFLQNIADRAALAIANARLFEALDESEARFRASFEESALGIKLSGLDGRILAANPALADMLGYEEAELVGMYFTDLTYDGDLRANRALFQQLISGAISRYRVEKRYVHKDGSLVWGRQAVSLVKDEAGTPQFVIAMIENISERKEMESELAEVRRRLIDSREAERLQLSQEIHDGPMQELYGVSFQVDALSGEEDPAVLGETMERMQLQLREIIQELRVICGQLRPPTLAPFGLEKTIRSHAETFRSEHPEIALELDLQPDAQGLPESVRLALFRVYQQSLANIVRHAEASQVSVRFSFDAESVSLEIRDNGRGFEVPERWVDLVRKGHYGLAGAAERAEAIDGRLEVESEPGRGACIRLLAPLPPPAAS